MQLDSIVTVGPLITAGAAIIVGVVTRWTQKGVAKDRIRWEGRLEIAKLDVARFETTLKHLIEAADAGTRYVVALGDIDATEYDEREPYVFALLEPLGRARVEAHALPDFPGVDEVRAAIGRLGKLVRPPESNKDLLDVWDPRGLGDAINLLSKGRSTYMHQVMQPETSGWRRLLAGRSGRTSPAGRPSTLSSGAARPDIST
ncbi:hypothetical protein ACIQF5_14715 [Streptomyces goshikiensis]|uniref:hypothetical protein n=1 Tax=Streptomyces goshikiensis TaxID=1942 RepID=UPI003819DB03